MLAFLLKRHDGHTEQSLLEAAAEQTIQYGLTVDELLYLYCRR